MSYTTSSNPSGHIEDAINKMNEALEKTSELEDDFKDMVERLTEAEDKIYDIENKPHYCDRCNTIIQIKE